MRHLPTDNDILDACYWRVSGVSVEQVHAEQEIIRQWLDALPSFDLIHENDPATAEILDRLKRPNDRRSAWGLLIALITLEGHRNDDRALFYRAGCLLAIQIHSQSSRRASRPLGGDALSQLVSACVTDHPDARPEDLADSLSALAGNYAYPTLVDSDPDTGTLTCQIGDSLRDVSREALLRRIQRARHSG